MLLHSEPIRFAVVGTGWFGQTAVLPAFVNTPNAKLVAIVSGDPEKRQELSERYEVVAFDYPQYDDLLAGGEVDAVFIVLPNALHHQYTVMAAKRGIHVLCEKPLAASSDEARSMIDVCKANNVLLMTAYRLHFESANLAAVELIRDGAIGDPRVFHGINTQQVDEGNTRLNAHLAGSPLRDLGVYCINAARYLFRDDPIDAFAFAAERTEERFRDVPEMVTALLRFSNDRLATFTCGFGEAKVSEYRVIGTTGDIRLDPAFSFSSDLNLYLTQDGKTKSTRYREHDQVGAEIEYFSKCIQNGTMPEPCGREGLADLLIIEAIEESWRTGRPVTLKPFPHKARPDARQEYQLSKVSAPELVNAAPPSAD